MLRLRLAYFALASGFLFTLSGCCSFCEDGRLFPRLFRSNSAPVMGMPGDCGCHSAMLPPTSEMGTGPMLMTPGSYPVPITNVPSNPPPKILQAQPTPFSPTN